MTEQESTTTELMPFAQCPIGDQTTLTVNARDLYAYLEHTGAYSIWINRAIKRANLVENIDYTTTVKASGSKGGRPVRGHLLTPQASKVIKQYYEAALRRRKSTYLYAVKQEGSQSIKIGIAIDCALRLAGLQNGNPSRLYFLGIWDVGRAAQRLEKSIHSLFYSFRLRGEWFSLSKTKQQQLLRMLKKYPRVLIPDRVNSVKTIDAQSIDAQSLGQMLLL
jgi:phage anti-repressor protein